MISLALRAVPMGYLLSFLSILIKVTAKQIAKVIIELIRRDIAKQKKMFLPQDSASSRESKTRRNHASSSVGRTSAIYSSSLLDPMLRCSLANPPCFPARTAAKVHEAQLLQILISSSLFLKNTSKEIHVHLVFS